MTPVPDFIPQHQTSHWIITGEVLCVLGATGLVLAHGLRLAAASHLADTWLLFVALAAWPAADFASGIVHWLGDTWGSERWPFLGPRFIRPFRVHHVNPQGMLASHFFDTNGDSALVTIPILLAVFAIPLENAIGRGVAAFLTAFCFWGMPTNQIHYWAHQNNPPRWVAWLQKRRLILSPEHHLRHHTSPFLIHYCITTGWCNILLDNVRFFRILELVVQRLTGATARSDDEEYAARLADQTRGGDSK
jgi:hypothetical protein